MSARITNWLAATLIALALSMAWMLDGPSEVQSRIDSARAAIDAELDAAAAARFAKAAQAVCGQNAGWRLVSDGTVQCLTKRGHKTNVVRVVL